MICRPERFKYSYSAVRLDENHCALVVKDQVLKSLAAAPTLNQARDIGRNVGVVPKLHDGLGDDLVLGIRGRMGPVVVEHPVTSALDQ